MINIGSSVVTKAPWGRRDIDNGRVCLCGCRVRVRTLYLPLSFAEKLELLKKNTVFKKKMLTDIVFC